MTAPKLSWKARAIKAEQDRAAREQHLQWLAEHACGCQHDQGAISAECGLHREIREQRDQFEAQRDQLENLLLHARLENRALQATLQEPRTAFEQARAMLKSWMADDRSPQPPIEGVTAPRRKLGVMQTLWGREPVLVLAVVQTGLALVLAFGVKVTVEQMGAVMAVSAAVLGLITRSQVKPAVPV